MLVWTACSSKKDVTPPPPTPASIALAAGSSSLSVAQNTAGNAALTLTRTNFTGDVALTAEGLPTGVTATFTPASLTSGATSSSVSLAVASTAAVTSTPAQITIRARGTGVTDATTPLALTITATVTGAISITATPTTASITAGQQATTKVKLTRSGGFAGGVNFTVTGAPTGMTTTFASANPFTGDSLNLSVSTLTSVTPGSYALTVRANSAGLTEATAPYTVNVAAPPSNSVTWRFCDPARIPLWFAYQDGETAAWNVVTPTSPGVYTFSYGQPRVGITTVANDGSVVFTQVSYLATAEVATQAAAECTDYPAPATKTLTGTISGFAAATEVGLVSMGTALSSSTNQATPNFTITKVPNGAVDLIAIRADLVTSNVARMLLTRGTNFANGASIGTLDLAAGTSFAPATGSITISAPNDGTLLGQAVFTTATGSSASFTTPQLSSGVTATYQGVPDAKMIASDLQEIQVSQSVGTTISRFITRYTRGPTAVSLTMPADPGLPTVTNLAGATYARASISGSLPAAFNDFVSIEFAQTSRSRRWEINATAAARTAVSSYAFTLPNFDGLPGWLTTWGLASGAADVTGGFYGQTGTNPDGTPTTGTQMVLTGRFFTFTFP